MKSLERTLSAGTNTACMAIFSGCMRCICALLQFLLELCLSGTVSQGTGSGNWACDSTHLHSYLPGRGDTMIKKVLHPGRGPAIALWLTDPCEFPKCGNLDCKISGSGGLRPRSPLVCLWKKGWKWSLCMRGQRLSDCQLLLVAMCVLLVLKLFFGKKTWVLFIECTARIAPCKTGSPSTV